MKLSALALLFACATSLTAQQTPKRLFIEERIVTKGGASTNCDTSGNCTSRDTTRTRNTSAEVTRLFVSSCPAVTITGNADSADYVLKIAPGNSIVYMKNGDVAYISPAKFKLENVVKDVCHYLGAH